MISFTRVFLAMTLANSIVAADNQIAMINIDELKEECELAIMAWPEMKEYAEIQKKYESESKDLNKKFYEAQKPVRERLEKERKVNETASDMTARNKAFNEDPVLVNIREQISLLSDQNDNNLKKFKEIAKREINKSLKEFTKGKYLAVINNEGKDSIIIKYCDLVDITIDFKEYVVERNEKNLK